MIALRQESSANSASLQLSEIHRLSHIFSQARSFALSCIFTLMLFSLAHILLLGLALDQGTTKTNAAYNLARDYSGNDFFSEWDFYGAFLGY